ncbi:MAG: hypothetical protein JRI36_08105 [Deltaproteobacteria bacterium]|nr:hypothetical protein [Deltaproteobacteria bacterium]
MATEMIRFTENSVTLRTDTPRPVGSEINVEVGLPKGILVTSFVLNGTITDCRCIRTGHTRQWELDMVVGRLSPVTRQIFEAYKDYLEREKMLNEISFDLEAFRQAFENFSRKLHQLRKTAQEVKDNVRGTLELMQRDAGNKTTIH